MASLIVVHAAVSVAKCCQFDKSVKHTLNVILVVLFMTLLAKGQGKHPNALNSNFSRKSESAACGSQSNKFHFIKGPWASSRGNWL